MWRLAVALAVGCGRIGFGDRAVMTDDGAPFGDGELVKLDGQVASAHLVAWYPMDDLPITTVDTIGHAPDVTGHGHGGTCSTGIPIVGNTCPTVVPGRIGNAYQFDGANSQIEVAGGPSLELTTGFTIAMWLSAAQLPVSGSRACPASQLFGTTTGDSWQLCVESDGRLFFYTVSATTTYSSDSATTLPTGSWHHLAIRWDGATKTTFLDGGSVATQSGAAAAFDGRPIYFGVDLDSGSVVSPYGGRIDDLRIYDAALTDGDIALLAQ